MKATVKLQDMGEMMWYNWYGGFATTLAVEGIYSKGYEEQNRECIGTYGFICDDPDHNANSDLPLKYKSHVATWSKYIHVSRSSPQSAGHPESTGCAT